ncbi:MAG: hypothetical protein KDA28_09015 [Phycisphaerales bacterium]|nr:hypothetical protein [Phycisphaerales bacterium]
MTRYEADCMACGVTWPNPMPSTHRYGVFIARGDTVAAFLDSNESPAWSRIAELHARARGGPTFEPELFQALVSSLIDPIDGEDLSIHHALSCPECGSSQVVCAGRHPIDEIDVPVVTFRTFMALSTDEQFEAVCAILEDLDE